MREILDLLDKAKQLRMELRDINLELCQLIESDKMPLSQAVALGLVKPNFSAPPGYMRYLKDKYKQMTDAKVAVPVRVKP